MPRAFPHPSLFPPREASILLLSFLVVSCGDSLYSVNQGEVAQRFIPQEQTVHHPDSLQDLSITEGEEKIQYQLAHDYQALIEKWSSTYRRLETERSVEQPQTYATLWSLELALASLQPERGIVSLRKEKAQEFVRERRKSHGETIRIDVFVFTGRGMNGILVGPRARTDLRVGDHTLSPVRGSHGPLRQTFISDGGTELYRRNTLHFPRIVDGTDILAENSGIELTIDRSIRFAWTWQK